MKAAKNVIDGNLENALPELDFGADLGKGFMLMVIGLIYSLPVAILTGLTSLTISFVPEVEEAVQVLLYVVGGCMGLIGLLLGLLIAFLSAVGIANYIAKVNLKQLFASRNFLLC